MSQLFVTVQSRKVEKKGRETNEARVLLQAPQSWLPSKRMVTGRRTRCPRPPVSTEIFDVSLPRKAAGQGFLFDHEAIRNKFNTDIPNPTHERALAG